jgi:hypothetical protein
MKHKEAIYITLMQRSGLPFGKNELPHMRAPTSLHSFLFLYCLALFFFAIVKFRSNDTHIFPSTHTWSHHAYYTLQSKLIGASIRYVILSRANFWGFWSLLIYKKKWVEGFFMEVGEGKKRIEFAIVTHLARKKPYIQTFQSWISNFIYSKYIILQGMIS